MRRVRFTKEGYQKAKKEYQDLLEQRKPAVVDLQKAREMGDLSENGYYKASKAKLASIDSRLKRLRLDLNYANVIDSTHSSIVNIGATVTVSDGKRSLVYKIVGDLEADPSSGKISLLSPIGQAMSGKKKGDQVEIKTPSGVIFYKIVQIS